MALHTREAVRVKVKKCEANIAPEWRKFSVDPQITTLEVLYSLLAKAFEIKSDFSIKYKAFDPAGNEIYLAVLSDWDLDAAFLRIHNISIQTSTEPCLILQIDVKPFTEVRDWDVESPSAAVPSATTSLISPTIVNSSARELMSPLQQSLGVSQKYVQHMQTKLPGLIMNHMEKTFSIVQKAFNLSEETMASLPPRAPLSDSEFRLFLDAVGQIQRSDELRKVIFFGGIEPSLRRVVWKHILNVYPSSMNGHQRMDYMRRKAENYYKLRDTWKSAIKHGCVAPELSYVTSMVKKDVLRTDRLHPFYAGNDDNQNIASLFNILTTYALNHPTVSYCQGMSDIASPLLVTMNDEAQAYICFCAIMSRVRGNFLIDGISMTQKFTHLTEALSFYDPEFWEYLKSQQADDLLFCYRWLLLELKREFPFDDALRMLEVQWSSLKYEMNVSKELKLFEKEFVPVLESSAPTSSSSLSGSFGPLSPSYLMTKAVESPYTKVCAIRRQNSSASLNSLSSSLTSNSSKLESSKRLNQSLDDSGIRLVTRRHRNSSSIAHQSLDEAKMLSLIEGIDLSDVKRSQNVDIMETVNSIDAGDDDVFDDTENRPNQSKVRFHPTNPFKEDVQLSVDVATNEVDDAPKINESIKAIANVFRSSSSSSLTEQDGSKIEEEAIKNNVTGFPGAIDKLQHQKIFTNYSAVSNIISKQIATATEAGASVKRSGSTKGGHFKELKERIAASSRIGSSLDESKSHEQSQQKLVKNFNEFLNFATTNKNRIAEKFNTETTTTDPDALRKSTSPSPTRVTRGTLSKSKMSSLDDSDSSSVPDTTWSGSTAATAIQDRRDLSNSSIHIEMNSLSSGICTPTSDHRSSGMEDSHANTHMHGHTPTVAPFRNIGADLKITPDDIQDQEYYPMSTAITREIRLEADILDRQMFGEVIALEQNCGRDGTEIGYKKLERDSLDMVQDLKENEIIRFPDFNELLEKKRHSTAMANVDNRWQQDNVNINGYSHGQDSEVSATLLASSLEALNLNPFLDNGLSNGTPEISNLQNSSSLPEIIVPISTETQNATPVEVATNAADEIAFSKTSSPKHGDDLAKPPPTPPVLPPPTELGGGNPFLIFLCLTLLLQHRNVIIKNGMDYNEIAMHFDKMVRKHDVTRVLNQARRMYIDYLKTQNAYNQRVQKHNDEIAIDINKNRNAAAPGEGRSMPAIDSPTQPNASTFAANS